MSSPKILRALLAVALRELWSYRILWLAAGVLGVMLPLGALLPTARQDPFLVRDALVSIAAGILLVGSILALGGSILTGEYAAGRMAFYLARPVPAVSLWLGKILARAGLTLGAGLLVLAPTLLLGGRPWQSLRAFAPSGLERALSPSEVPFGPWSFRFHHNALVETVSPYLWLVALALGAVLVACAAHLLATMLRLRNYWTLADFAALGALGSLAAGTFTHLAGLGAEKAQVGQLVAVGLALVPAALFGGWAQIRWGGGDPVRAHGVQSLILWTLCAAALAPSFFQARSLERLGPEDLDQIMELHPAPRGPWALVAGQNDAAGYRPTFAWNSRTRESIRLEVGGMMVGHRFFFSEDGTTLVYPGCSPPGDSFPCGLQLVELDADGGAERRPLGMKVDMPYTLDVSHDGSRLAVFHFDRIEFFRLPEGVRTHSVPLPDYWVFSVHFASKDDGGEVLRIRAAKHRPGPTTTDSGYTYLLLELDPTDPEAVPVETFELPSFNQPLLDGGWFHGREEADASDRADRVLVRAHDGRRLTLPTEPAPWAPRLKVLGDGRILHSWSPRIGRSPSGGPPDDEGGDSYWTVLDPDREPAAEPGSGIPVGEIDLLGGEVAPGRVLVGTYDRQADTERQRPAYLERFMGGSERWQTRMIDVDTGEVLHVLDGYLPLWCSPRLRCKGHAGAPGSDWLIDARGRPYRFLPESGETLPLMGPDENEDRP